MVISRGYNNKGHYYGSSNRGRYYNNDDSGCSKYIFGGAFIFAVFIGGAALTTSNSNYIDENHVAIFYVICISLIAAIIVIYFKHRNKIKKLLEEGDREIKKLQDKSDKEKDELKEALHGQCVYSSQLEICIKNKDLVFQSLKDSNEKGIVRIASLLSDHELVQCDISSQYLKAKIRPALVEAQRIDQLKRETKKYIEQYRIMLYKYEALLGIFPELSLYVEDFETIKELSNIEKVKDLQEDYDRVNNYLSKEEYLKLGVNERNELALSRYVNGRNKSNWQIGRDYEMYCAHVYRTHGWTADAFGIEKGLNDMGRDIIAWKDKDLHIIQCKYWASGKVIHEKHIAQLYGSVVEFAISMESYLSKREMTPTPVFITNIDLSKTAKKFATRLGVKVFKWDIGEFPRIKCNINNGGRIYHLPFDQQYDRTKIENEGELYAFTVKEATSKGFRRAFRHIQN